MATLSELRAAGLTLAVEERGIEEPLAAPESLKRHLERFPDTLYNTTPDSHLFRFLLALCGDAGAGAMRKHYALSKLQSTLSATHFGDLDRLYANPFQFPRLSSEIYDIDPKGEVLTRAQWREIFVKDAQYRGRCLLWMRALAKGPTLEGIALAAEAATGVECEVFERYAYLENQASDDVITIPNIGKTSSVREFVIVPRTLSLSQADQRRLVKLLDILRPVDTIMTVHTSPEARTKANVRAVASTSELFHIGRIVRGRSDIAWPALDTREGFWIEGSISKEAPTRAFLDRQEAATFITISSAEATTTHIGAFSRIQRSLFAHLAQVAPFTEYTASQAFANSFVQISLVIPWVNNG